MRILISILLLFLCISMTAQETVITKTAIPLGIQVQDTLTLKLLDISNLCDGFDEENKPINFITPPHCRTRIFILNTDARDIPKYRLADQSLLTSITYPGAPEINIKSRSFPLLKALRPGNFTYEGDSVLLAYNSAVFPGITDTINVVSFIREKPKQSSKIIITGDRPTLTVMGIYMANEMTQLFKKTESNGFFDLISSKVSDFDINGFSTDRSYDNWLKQGYFSDTTNAGLPINPVFPYNTKNLFVKLSRSSESINVFLERFGVKKAISDPFSLTDRVLYLKDLTNGHYKLIIEDNRVHYGSKTTFFEFTIADSFWHQGGYWLAILIPLLTIFFFIYRTYIKIKINRLNLNKQLSEAELKAIRAQLNPHFLFNALNAIQNLVNKQDSENANQYIAKLSKLMRKVLAQSDDTMHALAEEIEISKLYLELEKLRSPFEYNIKVDSDINQNMLVPSMILQPYIENAVIHGVIHGNGDYIDLNIYLDKDACIFTVSDNGQGSSKTTGNGKGLKLGQERLDIIKKQLGNKTYASVSTDKLPEGGFCVTIQLPKDL